MTLFKRRKVFFTVLLIGLALRLILVIAFYGNDDQAVYEKLVTILRRGGDVYTETNLYNYTPLWGFVLLGTDWLSETLYIPLHVVIRGILTIVDLANALLIAFIAHR